MHRAGFITPTKNPSNRLNATVWWFQTFISKGAVSDLVLSVQDCDWVLAKIKEFPGFFSWLLDEGALYVIKALLDSGRLSIDLNGPNDSNKDAAAGDTYLHRATMALLGATETDFQVREAILNMLLQHPGVNPNIFTRLTPEQSLEKFYKYLRTDYGYRLIRYANLNLFDWVATPMMYSVLTNHDVLVKIFLQAEGIDPNLQDSRGNTTLMIAVQLSNLVVFRALMQDPRVDLNRVNKHWRSALNFACEAGGNETDRSYSLHQRQYVVEQLLQDPRCDPNQGFVFADCVEAYNHSPWNEKCFYKEVLARLLLHKGFDPNASTALGKTALMLAAQHHNLKYLVGMLLDIGANPSVKSGEYYGNTTALHWACAAGITESVLLIAERMRSDAHPGQITDTNNQSSHDLSCDVQDHNAVQSDAPTHTRSPEQDRQCQDDHVQHPYGLFSPKLTGINSTDRADSHVESTNEKIQGMTL